MNKIKKIGFFLLLVLVCGSISAQTLKQAVIQTIHTNPDVLITIKGWQAAGQGIKQAQGEYFPSLDLSAGTGINRVKNASTDFEYNNLYPQQGDLLVTQNLFEGFKTINEVDRNKKRTLAEAYQVAGSANDTALLAIQAYLDILRTNQILTLAQKNYAAHTTNYNMVKHRTLAGLSRQADLTQSFGRLSLAKANLLAAQNNYQDTKDIYYKVVGEQPKNLITPKSPDDNILPRTEQVAIQSAINSHPLLKAAKADVQEAIAQKRSARSPFWPRIDATAVGTKGTDLSEIRSLKGEYDNYGAFLSLKYNLFKGGSDVARLRETSFLEEQSKQIRNRTYDQTVENMQLAWNGLVTSRAQLTYFKKHRDASKMTLAAYQQQFKLGKRTLLDLLNSNEELFNAATDYVNGQYKLLFAKFRVLNAEGMLLPYLQIPVPVIHTITEKEKADLDQQEHSTKVRLPHLREYPMVRKG